MFLRLLVIDQELAFAAEATRLLLRDAHDRENRVAFVENCVHLLEAAARSLRVEEVDDRNDESISDLKEGKRKRLVGRMSYQK